MKTLSLLFFQLYAILSSYTVIFVSRTQKDIFFNLNFTDVRQLLMVNTAVKLQKGQEVHLPCTIFQVVWSHGLTLMQNAFCCSWMLQTSLYMQLYIDDNCALSSILARQIWSPQTAVIWKTTVSLLHVTTVNDCTLLTLKQTLTLQ